MIIWLANYVDPLAATSQKLKKSSNEIARLKKPNFVHFTTCLLYSCNMNPGWM